MNVSADPPDAADVAMVARLEVEKTIELSTTAHSLALSPDETTIYAACLDGGIYSVDPQAGSAEKIAFHNSYASGVKCLPRSHFVVSGGYDGVLQWHDPETRQTVRRIDAHRFWSWDLAVSPDGVAVASVSGQYRAGGSRYEPAPADEPTVRVFDGLSGDERFSASMLPPVQAVTFSPDSRFLAAGNLMGDFQVWDAVTGESLAAWNSPAFTTWGTSKSAHFSYGVFGIRFTPDSNHLLACGIGPMYDPIAVNGKQTWQRFAWSESPVRVVDEIHEGDHGGGAMEALTFHPSGSWFAMGGRMTVGKWNLAAFHAVSGDQLATLDISGARLTECAFSRDGERLFASGGIGQKRERDGQCPPFGRIFVVRCIA